MTNVYTELASLKIKVLKLENVMLDSDRLLLPPKWHALHQESNASWLRAQLLFKPLLSWHSLLLCSTEQEIFKHLYFANNLSHIYITDERTMILFVIVILSPKAPMFKFFLA